MRVLIVAEGKNEIDRALEALVKRLAPGGTLQCESDRISRNDIHTHHGKGQGFLKRSLRWLLEAKKKEYDALVLVIDEDGHPERSEQINAAQEHLTIETLPRAFGVAIRTFDAWMLADEQALIQVIRSPIRRQPDPESTQSSAEWSLPPRRARPEQGAATPSPATPRR